MPISTVSPRCLAPKLSTRAGGSSNGVRGGAPFLDDQLRECLWGLLWCALIALVAFIFSALLNVNYCHSDLAKLVNGSDCEFWLKLHAWMVRVGK